MEYDLERELTARNAATPGPIAPPTVPQDARYVTMLLDFLKDHDVRCPRCDYNLRNLTQPVCPECREALSLKVDVEKLRAHWLLLTLAPGVFCAIAMCIFIAMCMIHGSPGRMRAEEIMIITFMVISGATSIGLGLKYHSFLRLRTEPQIIWAMTTWAIHILVFLMVATL